MEIKKWLGLKNTTSAERLKPGHLDAAQNVDIDDSFAVRTRTGTTLADPAAFHSLWADEQDPFVVVGQDLYRVNADYSKALLGRLSSAAPVSYNRQLNVTYLSNGVDSKRVVDGRLRPWGLAAPGQPQAAPGAGSLPPGRYHYAATYRRSDGTESGSSMPGRIDLASQGGIAFTGLTSSSDSDVVEALVYLSGADGEELFLAGAAPTGTSTFNFSGTGTELGRRLETVLDSPPPAGTIVESYNGVMYVVKGQTAYHSYPYQFERFRLRDMFLQFPGPVTLFASVNDGIYVGTDDRVWFLQGDTPGAMKSSMVFDYGAIPGTSVKTTPGVLKSKEEFDEGEPGRSAVMWTSPQGICIGMEGGMAENLTERDYSFPSAARGAAIIRQVRGQTQYLAVLAGAGVADNAYS